MTKLQIFAVSLTVFAAISMESMALHARAVPGSSQPPIAVSIALDNDRVPVGRSPWAILTVKNLTDHEVAIHDVMYQVHVDGDKGEAPTTLAQRRITRKLRPVESDLRGDEMSLWTLAPGESGVRKFQLAYLYDLSSPGKYKVYGEVVVTLPAQNVSLSELF